jgi:hypothetical protein
MSKLRLVFLGLALAVAMVGIMRLIAGLSAGTPIVFHPQLDLMQVMMVAIPFLVLAMGGIRARSPWLVGVALTIAVWAFALLRTMDEDAGAEPATGLGLFLLASPLLISIACIAAFAIDRRMRRDR